MRGLAYFAAEVTKNADNGGSTVSFKLPTPQEIRGTFLLADRMNLSQCSFVFAPDLGADLSYLEEIGFLELSYEPLSLAEMEERQRDRQRRYEQHMMRDRDSRGRFEEDEIQYSDPRWSHNQPMSLSQMMRLARLTSFEKLHAADPDYWSLCSTGDVNLHDSGEYSEWNSLGLSLMRAIPVPDKEVPLEEIRLFKEKRKDQLLKLWHALDDARLRIIASPLPLAAHRRELENIELALLELRKVAAEWKFPKRLVDLHSAINLPISTLATAAVQAGVANHRFFIAGVAADLMLSVRKGLRTMSKQEHPFEYIARYGSDVSDRF